MASSSNASCSSMKTTSNGIFQGDNPLHFSFSLLILQIVIVLLISRTLAFCLRPLRQPRVIAEIIGGILLGPSALGRIDAFTNSIFPKQSLSVLETIANIGLLFFLFLVGLELDMRSIKKTGRNAVAIAIAGISVPFVSGIGVAFVLRATIADNVPYGPFLLFMGVALSITAFPVLARILAELKLLTTDVGRIAMSAAAVNDVVAWVLLALAVALSGTGRSPVVAFYVLICGIAFVVFAVAFVRPLMAWIGKRSPEGEPIKEHYICFALAAVLMGGFVTDFIGIHGIFGAFVLGLIIPKEGPFAGMLIEKIEDFVSCLLLPLYFASSGLKTNVATIHGSISWGLLVMVIAVACAGKILGTFFVASVLKVPFRESMTLGFLMNTKGLVELIVLNIGKDRKVLNDECFAILVLMALFTTFITTPIVLAIYKPARKPTTYKHRKIQRDTPEDELRILACIHGTRNIPAIINLVEASRGIRKKPLRLYIMHLVELSERSSAIMLVHKARRDGLPFWNRNKSQQDQIVVAFEAYGQLSKVAVRPMTAISALQSMHEDVCEIATQKRAAMIILPYHKHLRVDGTLESVHGGFREINQRALRHAPCSVGILVDRGLGGQAQLAPSSVAHNVAVLFFGGPDDREAVVFGTRMAEHPGIKLTVIRFMLASGSDHVELNISPLPAHEHEKHPNAYKFSAAEVNIEHERLLDEEALSDVLKSTKQDSTPDNEKHAPSAAELGESIIYQDIRVLNTMESVMDVAKSDRFDLFLVGKGRFPSPLIAGLVDRPAECPELGPVADMLASSSLRIKASVLVIQQHDTVHNEEVPFAKIA